MPSLTTIWFRGSYNRARVRFILTLFFCVDSQIGSNGSEFMFLLKGHEDLRQDERVMQLFGLVNTLLAGDQETSKRHLG